MPAATSIIIGVMAASSVYTAVASTEAARDAEKLQAEALGMSREQYKRYLDIYAPLEEELAEMAGAPVEDQPGVQAALSEVDAGAATRGASLRRMMSGRAPGGSGLEYAGNLATDIARTEQRGDILADAGEAKFQRMLQSANLGRGIPGAVATNIANTANVMGQNAQTGFAGAGASLGNLAQLYMLSQNFGGGGVDPFEYPTTIDRRTQGGVGR